MRPRTRYILPADVLLIPVRDLDAEVRRRIDCSDSDYAITRPRTRAPSKIVNVDAAALLQEFRTPKTIAQAVAEFARSRGLDAEQALAEAHPLLEEVARAELLAPAESAASKTIAPALAPGDSFAGGEVVRYLQILEDTQLYLVQREGSFAALKLAPATAAARMKPYFDREAAILERLEGLRVPRVLASGECDGCPYLMLEWCEGLDSAAMAARLRQGGQAMRGRLLELCGRVLDAYAGLHARRVIHGDVHPRNVIAGEGGEVWLIDFGFARIDEEGNRWRSAPRGGLAYFIEPEYADALLHRVRPPIASEAGEQFATAALIFHLLSGRHYLDFAFDRDAMLRDIAERASQINLEPDIGEAQELESALARALSKQPADRFATVAEFRDEFREACETRAPAAPHSPLGSILSAFLNRVQPDGELFRRLPTPPSCSVNFGAAGIAFALYRLACSQAKPEWLAWADTWIVRLRPEMRSAFAYANPAIGLRAEDGGPASLLHSASGIEATHALIHHARGDLYSREISAQAFLSEASRHTDKLDLTLGLASSLLGCAMLYEAFAFGAARVHGDVTLRQILERTNRMEGPNAPGSPLNLGIAHGWAGIAYAELRWRAAAGGDDAPPRLVERLEALASLAEPAGRGVRWRWELDREGASRMPLYMAGWCNGTTGYVFLWTLAARLLGEERWLSLAERAAWDVWESPETGPTLCCGLIGRAYALLHFARQTGETAWIGRAQELAARAALARAKFQQHRDSLYKGETGLALLCAEIEAPAEARFPFFEEEG